MVPGNADPNPGNNACAHEDVVCDHCRARVQEPTGGRHADLSWTTSNGTPAGVTTVQREVLENAAEEEERVAEAVEIVHVELPVAPIIKWQNICMFWLFALVITTAMWMHNKVMNEVPCTDEDSRRPYNFLPCVSATISVEPQRYIFRIVVGMLMAGPGFFQMWAWHRMLMRRAPHVEAKLARASPCWRALSFMCFGGAVRFYKFSVWMCTALHFGMGLGLLTTTYVMNREIFIWHAFGTTSFLCFMNMFVPLHCCLVLASRPPKPSEDEQRATKIKLRCWAGSWVSSGLLLLSWQGHVAMCLDYAHSWFSFFEYIVIFICLVFESSGAHDFRGYKFYVGDVYDPNTRTTSYNAGLERYKNH